MFPRSLPADQVGDIIPDSQPASCSGGNMGGNQEVEVNKAANILEQLSFEEIFDKNSEDEDLEEGYSSNHHEDGNSGYNYPDGFEHNNFDSDNGNHCHNDNNNDNLHHDPPAPTASDSEPLQAQSLQVIPVPGTQLTAEVQSESSKAPLTGKKAPRIQTQKGQSRSSSRLTKALQVADPPSQALPSPIQQPIIDTTDHVPPPKPKCATRGRAVTKGKTQHAT